MLHWELNMVISYIECCLSVTGRTVPYGIQSCIVTVWQFFISRQGFRLLILQI